jgi:phosphoglucomutase/phosphomannomutase
MDLLAQVRDGLATVDVDPAQKERALVELKRWLTQPEFEPYREQLKYLIEEHKWAGLLDRFYQVLPFGTGGRRGGVGIGPNRMNPWTLGASVQGHCEYLRQRFSDAAKLHVVLGFDVRRFEDVRKQYNPALPNPLVGLTSRALAQHAACVYAANGIHSWLLPADSPRYLSTPELSFSIRYLRSHGGLNISASHNPPDDNGGKFYDERGGQPVPPDDQIMADLVEQVTTIRSLPWSEAQRSGKIHWLDEGPHHAYLDLVCRQALLDPAKPGELTLIYTPLHGVGSGSALPALEKQRFRVLPVAEQMEPNGLFPNVTSPNPEVPASMDRALALAKQHPAVVLILSTDPDADRLGAVARLRGGERQGDKETKKQADREAVGSGWRFLTGNEIAALLAHFKLTQLKQQGRMPASPIVVKTEVTTGLITRIAQQFGCQVIDDLLVGFKYVADVLHQLEKSGEYGDVRGTPEDMVIACEESHGVLATPHVRDKDAAGGCLLLAELALFQQRRGLTVADQIEQLYREFGYFRNTLQNLAMSGILGRRQMEAMLNSLRSNPPKRIAGLDVTGFEDLLREDGRLGLLKGNTDRLGRNVLLFRLGTEARIALRPSGTEPKAKVYIEVCTPPCSPRTTAEQWKAQCRAADALAERIGKEFVELALGRAS